MAKTKRDTFKDLLAELQSKTVSAAKPVATIEERQYFLIVCEGERTEPIYFDYLKRFLPQHLLETVQIIGEGDNTINIVKKAIEERNARASRLLNGRRNGKNAYWKDTFGSVPVYSCP